MLLGLLDLIVGTSLGESHRYNARDSNYAEVALAVVSDCKWLAVVRRHWLPGECRGWPEAAQK